MGILAKTRQQLLAKLINILCFLAIGALPLPANARKDRPLVAKSQALVDLWLRNGKISQAQALAATYRLELSRLAEGQEPNAKVIQKIEVLFGEQVYFLPLPVDVKLEDCEEANDDDESFELKCPAKVGEVQLTFKLWRHSIMQMIGRSVDPNPELGIKPRAVWRCTFLAHPRSRLLASTNECTANEIDEKTGESAFHAWLQPRESHYTVHIRIKGKRAYREARRELAGLIAYGSAVFPASGTKLEPFLTEGLKSEVDTAKDREASRMIFGKRVAKSQPRLNEVADQGSPLKIGIIPRSDDSLPDEIEWQGEKLDLVENRVIGESLLYAEYAPRGEDRNLWKTRLRLRFWKRSLLSASDYLGEIALSTEARMLKGDPSSDYQIRRSQDGKSFFLARSHADRLRNSRYVEHSIYRAFRVPNGLMSAEWVERRYPPETIRGDGELEAFLIGREEKRSDLERALASDALPIPLRATTAEKP